ncbi:hypothetical protein [Methylobacterium sp. J-076]|uniref:SEL1-like repeat protein n=1 Tax=Methylobacterium sp. J-076 TaxID=2836655 RepID=UPI001FBB6176|nr:hypothetical protein [Methylobacterium sp. J-076]MCJ2015405.1 hypothetical protein [Methylobacterium sp. J-076]
MNRNATSHFDSFDPEVIEAARDVASRAGVPLEAWIASVVPQHFSPTGGGSQRWSSQPAVSLDTAIQPSVPEQARVVEETALAQANPAAAPVPEGFAALMTRLDGIDRSMEAERRAASLAEQKRLEEIELRIDRALQANPVQQVTERLGDIERRVAELDDQVSQPRPVAKRGKATAAEMREAVQAIRQRQRELSEQAQPASAVASMRRDLVRRLVVEGTEAEAPVSPLAAQAPADPVRRASTLPAYVIEGLQRQAAQLRELIAPLATVADIDALDNALDSLAAGISRARSDAEVPALALPLAVIRTRIDELDVSAAAAAFVRVGADLKHFANRLDVAIAFEEADADMTALDALGAELAEIRSAIALLAEPGRLEAVVARVQDLSEQIALIPPAEEPKVEESKAEEPEAFHAEDQEAGSVELADEIHALAEKVDGLQARADVEASARPQGAAEADMASIHAMLHSLAEKVDRVGERAGPDGLDALERQVLTLVDKIEAPHALDPALTSLERTMNDLMQQVEALRDVSPSDALIERAARTAVAETLKGASTASPTEFSLLRASLADMQARQIAADERLGATLEGVQSALDRLVNRLGTVDSSSPRPPSLDERLMTSTSVDAARSAHRPAQRDLPEAALALSSGEMLLEPGAPRPVRAPTPNVDKREPVSKAPAAEKPLDNTASADSDIKTSFIAAARRAAQAAQAELAAELPLDRPVRGRAAAPAAPVAGKMTRLRAEIDQHRKPLLLGLAAIVLTLGAIQTVSLRSGDDAANLPKLTPAPGTVATAKPADAQKVAEAPKAPAPQALPAPIPQDPATTQTVAGPRAPEPQPAPAAQAAQAKPAVPPVPNMAGLAGDLANVPASLAKVKLAALSGDGTATWELAMREADGRGMPRDLAAAAKLFEKLANVGYAPAQYKLGAHYEKGSGVARDLAQAKLWYGRAAEQGHARAMHNLGVIYAENPAAGGKPDFASAASWFRQGAEHGVRDSQYNIAVLYARGLGLTQDLVQSYVWFAAAAAQGDDDAGKKRDDVATKLNAPDLARAKSLAASFRPRKLDGAVNDPPALADGGQGPVSLLGAPVPTPLGAPAHKAI